MPNMISHCSDREPPTMQCGSRLLDLCQPQVMGVLNVTPDSFSDGGALNEGGKLSQDKVLARVETMIADGAAIIDVGGESTRPGAVAVPLGQEMDRVLPIVEAIDSRFETIISVDTSSPEIMLAAAKLGAGILNDVRALERQGAVAAAANTGLPVCLMHMQGSPSMMQNNPQYQNVIAEVVGYLSARAECCLAAGIDKKNIMIDPGFGFGKTVQHNLQLLKNLAQLTALGFPVLAGLSRKSIIGKILQRDVDQRLAGSLALAAMAVSHGAAIIRAHDVAETVDVVRLTHAIQQQGSL